MKTPWSSYWLKDHYFFLFFYRRLYTIYHEAFLIIFIITLLTGHPTIRPTPLDYHIYLLSSKYVT